MECWFGLCADPRNSTNRRRKMVDRIRPVEEPTEIEASLLRGRPFQKGNPGRPPGSKNKITRLLEELVEGQGQNITQKMLQVALDGNPRCLEYFMDRLMPVRRGRVLEQQLPKINGVNDIGPAMAAITGQLNKGELTTEEASDLIGFTGALCARDFGNRAYRKSREGRGAAEADEVV